MSNLPLILKSYFCFYPIFSDFEGIEIDAGFSFICPKCNIILQTGYQTHLKMEDIKFCFNCGCKIDGMKASEIVERYQRIRYKNKSKFEDILCESCGECKNRYVCKKENISMCDIIREKVRENMDIIIKVEPDIDGRPNHCTMLNDLDIFKELVNGKE